jgi:hypothetical protein
MFSLSLSSCDPPDNDAAHDGDDADDVPTTIVPTRDDVSRSRRRIIINVVVARGPTRSSFIRRRATGATGAREGGIIVHASIGATAGRTVARDGSESRRREWRLVVVLVIVVAVVFVPLLSLQSMLTDRPPSRPITTKEEERIKSSKKKGTCKLRRDCKNVVAVAAVAAAVAVAAVAVAVAAPY